MKNPTEIFKFLKLPGKINSLLLTFAWKLDANNGIKQYILKTQNQIPEIKN